MLSLIGPYEKSKKLAMQELNNRLFHILHGEYIWKQELLVKNVEILDQSIARSTIFIAIRS